MRRLYKALKFLIVSQKFNLSRFRLSTKKNISILLLLQQTLLLLNLIIGGDSTKLKPKVRRDTK